MRHKAIIVAAASAAGALAGLGLKRAIARKRYLSLPYGYGLKIKRAITIECPPDELYGYWRNLKNIPRLVDDIVAVDVLDDTRSHWTLTAPGGIQLEWDAEITIDRQNEMIGWRTLDGADIPNAGYVRFDRATGGRGTTMRVALQYNPPAGKLAAGLSTLMGERPGAQVEQALRRFKQLMEAGEVATAREKHPVSLEPVMEDVDIASTDSFPASDAPAWTGTTGSSPRRH